MQPIIKYVTDENNIHVAFPKTAMSAEEACVKLLARLGYGGKCYLLDADGVAFAEKSIRQTEKLSTSQPTTTLLLQALLVSF